MPFLRRALLRRTEMEPFAGVAQLLDELDSVSLMVCALEYDDDDTANLLRDQSPWCPFMETHLLHFATAHGCLRAVVKLRKCAKQSSGKPHITTAEDGGNESQRARSMAWLNVFRAYRFPEGVMYEAAKQGELDVIRWLHSTTTYRPYLAIEAAAHAGQLATAQWFAYHARGQDLDGDSHSAVVIEVMAPFDEDLGIFAWRASNALVDVDAEATGNYLRALVRRRGFAWTVQGKPRLVSVKTESEYFSQSEYSDPVVYAVEAGSIELLEVLYSSKDKHNWSFSQSALVEAVFRGHLDVLQWLLDHQVTPEYSISELVSAAMDANQVEILRWLDTTSELEDVSLENVRSAVYGGRLDAVVWAYERFPDLLCDEDALCLHKGFSFPNVVMWLHEHKGLRLDPKMLSSFIRQGDVGLLKSFLSSLEATGETVSIDSNQFRKACEFSSREIVQYLAETHNQWSEDAANLAGTSGDADVARWILSTGHEGWNVGQEAVLKLARLGEWDLLHDFAAAGRVDDRLRSFWRLSASRLKQSKVDYVPHFLYGHQHSDWPWVPRLAAWLLANYPDKICHARSLGAWAVEHGYTGIVHQLIALEYPTIFSTANFRRLLQNRSTTDESLVRVFFERRPELLSYRVFQSSAERNQRSLLKFLFSLIDQHSGSAVNFAKSVEVVVTTASKLGYLGLLKWVHFNISRAPMSPWPSARHGHVRILDWLHANMILDKSKLDAAIRASVRFGHVKVLQWYERTYDSECRFDVRELQDIVRR